MMSFMVSEAARGVDMAARYPAFYRRLQEEPSLREQFQDSLDLLLTTLTNTLEPLPGPPNRDLSFLQTRPRPECTLITAERGGWGMSFILCAEQLNHRFFPQPVEPVPRRGLEIGLDEDNWFTLIRATLAVDVSSWSVVLEGTPVGGMESTLHLVVMVIPGQERENENAGWQANLSWGNYEATVVIGGNGRASFPFCNMQWVLDESQPAYMSDLSLQLLWVP